MNDSFYIWITSARCPFRSSSFLQSIRSAKPRFFKRRCSEADVGDLILATGANGIGIGVVLQLYPERLADKPFALYLLVLGAVISVLALLIIPRWSYRPLEA